MITYQTEILVHFELIENALKFQFLEYAICDGFWRNLRLVLGSEICLTPATRWLGSPTKGPHNLTQEIAVKQ